MKKQKVVHWLWLIAVAVFFAALLVQVNHADYEIYGPKAEAHQINEQTNGTNETAGNSVAYQVLLPAHSSPRADSDGKTTGGEYVETSCYTGIESHGANGRNPWSVASYKYPQGTKLWIEGFGEKVVETVTARRFAHRVDIWFGETTEDYQACLKYGTQTKEIRIIS